MQKSSVLMSEESACVRSGGDSVRKKGSSRSMYVQKKPPHSRPEALEHFERIQPTYFEVLHGFSSNFTDVIYGICGTGALDMREFEAVTGEFGACALGNPCTEGSCWLFKPYQVKNFIVRSSILRISIKILPRAHTH